MVDMNKDNKNQFEIQSKDNQSSKREIFNLCVKNSWVLTGLTEIETKLEDVFREVTT